jgi:hypothetical protein
MTFRQAVERIGLSIERGTESVPNDERFHVLLGGQVVYSAASKAKALAEYKRRRDTLLSEAEVEPQTRDPREALRRERAERELRAMRSDSNVREKLRVPGRRGHR